MINNNWDYMNYALAGSKHNRLPSQKSRRTKVPKKIWLNAQLLDTIIEMAGTNQLKTTTTPSFSKSEIARENPHLRRAFRILVRHAANIIVGYEREPETAKEVVQSLRALAPYGSYPDVNQIFGYLRGSYFKTVRDQMQKIDAGKS